MNNKVYAKSVFRGITVKLVSAENKERCKAYVWVASNGIPMQCGHGIFFSNISEAIKCAVNAGATVIQK